MSTQHERWEDREPLSLAECSPDSRQSLAEVATPEDLIFGISRGKQFAPVKKHENSNFDIFSPSVRQPALNGRDCRPRGGQQPARPPIIASSSSSSKGTPIVPGQSLSTNRPGIDALPDKFEQPALGSAALVVAPIQRRKPPTEDAEAEFSEPIVYRHQRTYGRSVPQAKPLLISFNRLDQPGRVTRSADKAKARKKLATETIIDLLESDDEVLATAAAATVSLTKEILPMLLSNKFEAQSIAVGMLAFQRTCALYLNSINNQFNFCICGWSKDHALDELLPVSDVDGPYTGIVTGTDVHYIALAAKPTLRLKGVSVGPDRLLVCAANRSSLEDIKTSNYIIVYTDEATVRAFDQCLLQHLHQKNKKKTTAYLRSPPRLLGHADVLYATREERAADGDLWERRAVELVADGLLDSSSPRASRRRGVREDVDYSDPANRITYVVYPVEPDAVDAVTIYSGDLKRLEAGVYFNDNLIDLKIKHLLSGLDPEPRQRAHAFSCHFYSKLTERGSTGRAAHDLVSRWTKAVNIFEKAFVLFPINLHNHWSLAVLVRPYLLWVHLDAYMQLGKLKSPRKGRRGPISVEDPDSGSRGDGETPTPATAVTTPIELPADRPCLLFLDSLSMHPYSKIGKRLQSYVYFEYLVRRQAANEADGAPDRTADALRNLSEEAFADSLPLVKCRVPMQANGFDCGVFVCRFAQMILSMQPPSTEVLLDSKYAGVFADEFTQQDVTEERRRFGQMLGELHLQWEEVRRAAGLAENQEPVPAEALQTSQPMATADAADSSSDDGDALPVGADVVEPERGSETEQPQDNSQSSLASEDHASSPHWFVPSPSQDPPTQSASCESGDEGQGEGKDESEDESPCDTEGCLAQQVTQNSCASPLPTAHSPPTEQQSSERKRKFEGGMDIPSWRRYLHH